jgi:hypothetical protein
MSMRQVPLTNVVITNSSIWIDGSTSLTRICWLKPPLTKEQINNSSLVKARDYLKNAYYDKQYDPRLVDWLLTH